MPELTTLADLGWDDAVEAEREAMGVREGEWARVARIDRKWCTAWRAGADPIRLPAPEDLAVGDWVLLSGELDRIVERVPRHSALARRNPDGTATPQVIAANLDWVFLVHGLSAEPNQRRLERELVIAFESGASPVVVLTKVDLGGDLEAGISAAAEVAPGVPVLAVSSRTGAGLDELGQFTAGHRTIALLGASGAGKSTLINALVGDEALRTAAVRAFDGKGRHTTTASELVRLPDGGLLIDTPGLRSVALWSEGAGLDEAFSDVTSRGESCRFRNCAHDAEPGCAVQAAIAAGALPAARLRSWRNLHAELEALEHEQAEHDRSVGRGRRPSRAAAGDDDE